MMFKLGKKPAREDAVKLKFASYFKSASLPIPPMIFGTPWLIQQWGPLGNLDYGDCVWAGAAHETMLLRAEASASVPTFTSKTVLADYAAGTAVPGPAFNPSDPTTDNGTDVQTAAAYRQNTGIIDLFGNRHKIEIYTALHVGDLSQLALATYLLGATGIGVNLPSSAEDQFNRAEPWDVVQGDTSVGGHYIPCVGRNGHGNYLFVTWGRLQAATPAWVKANMDEGIAYVSAERLNTQGLSPEGFNSTALLDDFKQVTA